LTTVSAEQGALCMFMRQLPTPAWKGSLLGQTFERGSSLKKCAATLWLPWRQQLTFYYWERLKKKEVRG